MLRKIWMLLFLSANNMAVAADNFDISTNVLTAPQVRVADTLYFDVQLKVTSVVSVGNSVVAETYDTYNDNWSNSAEPSMNANNKWTSGGKVWSSGAIRCTWIAFYTYMNNSVKVEPGTAETYVSSGKTYNVSGKNLYQDVGLDPSNAHNQPTMTLGSNQNKMYGYYTASELSAAGYSTRPSAIAAPYGSFEQDWVFDATSNASSKGHLDACNGRFGVTPESPTTAVYHYFITDSYPFVPRCVFGAPATWGNDGSVN